MLIYNILNILSEKIYINHGGLKMKCPKCGTDLISTAKYCPNCGSSVVRTAIITLTLEEAKNGCLKELSLPDFPMPMRFNLRAGMKNDQVLKVNNAQFVDAGGNTYSAPLDVTIRIIDGTQKPVKGKKKKWWIPIVAAFGVILLIGAVNRLFDGDPTPTSSPTLTLSGSPSPTVSSDPTSSLPTSSPEPTPEATPSPTPSLSTAVPTTPPPTPGINDSVIPYLETRYLISSLPEDDFEIVAALYQSIMNFETTCVFPHYITAEELDAFVILLHYECPELFQIDYMQNYIYNYYVDSGDVFSVEMPYSMDMNSYGEKRAACESIIRDLAASMNGFSDAEKEKYIFDYIALSCHYDLYADFAGTPYGPLVTKYAKCDGFSLAFKWIADAVGLPSLCITADTIGDDIGHAWNIVEVNGICYNLDVTQSVRSDNYSDAEDEIVYRVFNVSDAWMSNYYIVHDFYYEYISFPVCTTMEDSYYAQRGLFVHEGEDYTNAMDIAFQQIVDNGGGRAHIQFESETDMQAFVDDLNTNLLNWFTAKGYSYKGGHYWTSSFNAFVLELNL